MSEPNTSGFQFPGMEDSGDLDVDAIFGSGAPTSDINPFDLPAAQTEQPTAPQEQPQPEPPCGPGCHTGTCPGSGCCPCLGTPACGAARPTGQNTEARLHR